MYLIFPIFGPVYASDRHKSMNPLLFSIVASMYNLSRLLLATTIGAYLIKVGKKNFIIIGFTVLIVCCCSFAALELIPQDASDYYFFGGSIAINFVQGIGGSIL
jgi:MFS family permease